MQLKSMLVHNFSDIVRTPIYWSIFSAGFELATGPVVQNQ